MSKERPRNVAASVRQRLLTHSREQGEEFQLVLTRYALERLCAGEEPPPIWPPAGPWSSGQEQDGMHG